MFKTGTVKNGTSGKVLSSPIFTLLQKLQSDKNESEDNTEYQSRTGDIDNAYLEAVKNNDLETAQKLVDEAAKKWIHTNGLNMLKNTVMMVLFSKTFQTV